MLHPGGFKDRAGRVVMFCSMGQDCLKSTCFVSHAQKKSSSMSCRRADVQEGFSLKKAVFVYSDGFVSVF